MESTDHGRRGDPRPSTCSSGTRVPVNEEEQYGGYTTARLTHRFDR
jgi:hypothetical protein